MEKAIDRLQELWTADQIKQLVELYEQVQANGFGELTIVVVKGRLRFFRPQFSISASFKEDEV